MARAYSDDLRERVAAAVLSGRSGREVAATFATWTNVQDILDGRSISNLHGSKHAFAFTGLITCGHCGCAITAEIKKGKYIYYHCSRSKGCCPEPYVRQEVLDEKFAAVLRRFRV